MRNILLVIVTLYTSLSYAQNDPSNIDSLSLPEYQLLKTQFAEIKDIHSVPEVVLNELKTIAHFKGKKFMANVNCNYNATDLVNTNYPDRRFVFAGKSDKLFIIYYEVGGIGYHLSLMMFDITLAIKPVLALTMFDKADSIPVLKEMIRQELPLKYYYEHLTSKSKIRKHNWEIVDFNF